MNSGQYILGTNFDANGTMNSARCFLCLSEGQARAIQTYAMAVLAEGSMDPATLLASASCMRCIPMPLIDAVQAVLLGILTGSVLTADELAEASACAECIPGGYQEHIKAYEFVLKAELTPDPEALLAAAECFMCLNAEQHAMIQTYLLCALAELDTCSNPGNSGTLPVPPAMMTYVKQYYAAGSEAVQAAIVTQIPDIVTFDPTACAVTGITNGGGDTFDCYEVGVIV